MTKLLMGIFIFASFLSHAQQTNSSADTSRRRSAIPAVGTVTPTRETPAHDPVMIKQNDKYYLFTTGNGISVFSSKDMKNWRK
jgi:beta-xylosidase